MPFAITAKTKISCKINKNDIFIIVVDLKLRNNIALDIGVDRYFEKLAIPGYQNSVCLLYIERFLFSKYFEITINVFNSLTIAVTFYGYIN